jgi:hypothetical protein
VGAVVSVEAKVLKCSSSGASLGARRGFPDGGRRVCDFTSAPAPHAVPQAVPHPRAVTWAFNMTSALALTVSLVRHDRLVCAFYSHLLSSTSGAFEVVDPNHQSMLR